jgi:hypothetical protein
MKIILAKGRAFAASTRGWINSSDHPKVLPERLSGVTLYWIRVRFCSGFGLQKDLMTFYPDNTIEFDWILLFQNL